LDLMFDPRRKMAAVGAATIAMLVGGYTVAQRSHSSDINAVYSGVGNKVVVQVAGAVKKPGLYTFNESARVDDAIQQAGGFDRNADGSRVNMAETLVDGEKIRIPRLDDPADIPVITLPTLRSGVQPLVGQKQPTAKSGSRSKAPGTWGKKPPPPPGGVSLNTASLEQLTALPGVGTSTAQKIIAFRTQIGGFKSVDQIMDVKGIGPAKFAKMRPYLKL